MAKQAGADMIIKISNEDSPETYTTLGGIRNATLTFNRETIDTTNQGSANRWRELLADAATKSITVSGSGVFADDAIDASLRTAAFDETANQNFQILVPSFGTFTGAWAITSLEYSGEHTDAVQFSVTLESAGAITFASV